MENEHRSKIKEILLFGFVTISVALILIVWINTFLDRNAENPYFYRELLQKSAVTGTKTAEQALNSIATITHAADHQIISTQTPDLMLLFTPESDN